MIIKIKDGDKVPDGAKYLTSTKERDWANASYYERINARDPMNYIPLFGSLFGTLETGHNVPVITVHHYEVES